MHSFTRSVFGVSFALFTFVLSLRGADRPYHLLKEISIGGEGGWDYLSVDSSARKLYVSHGTKIVAIDIDKEKVIGEIADTPGVHGLAVAPDLGLGFSSNGRENKVSIVDLKSLKTLEKVETGANPDAILFEPSQHEVYAFNGRASSATVLDGHSHKVISTIPLAGKPEFAVADPNAGRVYCNIEDKNNVAVIDVKKHQVADRWQIAPGEGASGMAIDLEHHRLFLGCSNKLMIFMNSSDGTVLDSVPIGQGVDACSFDPGTQFAFASCGDGTVTIAHEDSPEKLRVVQRLTTERGAKTMTLDPKTHKIYLGSAKFEAPSGQSEGGRQRPKMVSGTFKVLVYGMEP
jgi:DNA-binding beta-propeller fold protein YncE